MSCNQPSEIKSLHYCEGLTCLLKNLNFYIFFPRCSAAAGFYGWYYSELFLDFSGLAPTQFTTLLCKFKLAKAIIFIYNQCIQNYTQQPKSFMFFSPIRTIFSLV